jgi:hypothetical protein
MRVLGTVTLVLVLLFWSLATIAIDSITKPNREIAERLEAGAKRDERYFARVDALNLSEGMAVCPRELVRSVVTIKLAKVQVIGESGREPYLTKAIADAEAVVRKALGCFPNDGNLWLRLATLHYSLDGPTTGVEHMVELSALTAPSESWILVPRISLAAKLLDFQISGIREVLQTDIRVLLQYGRLSDAATLYLQLGEVAREVFEENILRLDDARRADLDAAIAAAVKSLPPERQP